jgi:hypothetical protein
MEVHHKHHVPKNWKEYITEFIMLFAAVSIGFLAENFRERQVEQHRAAEFIDMFKIEIDKNEYQIDSVIKQDMPLLNYYDSLMYALRDKSQKISLYDINKNFSLWIYRFANDKRIFDQMKNSGSLRYIKDPELIDKITEYEMEADVAEFRSFTQEQEQWLKFWDKLKEILPPDFLISANPDIYAKLISIGDVAKVELPKNLQGMREGLKTKYISDQARDIFAGELYERTILMRTSIANFMRVKKKGKALIEALDHYQH